MKVLTEKKSDASPPDFTLFLSRIENEIIKGKNLPACIKALTREDIWTRLEGDDQLKWARLAQMAGEVNTALQVLKHINHAQPDRVDAWTDRLDLLAILDRREELAKVLAESRPNLGQERCAVWLALNKPVQNWDDKDVEAAVAPFDRLQHRQRVIGYYLELFSGREDCFARQWVNKQEGKQGYVPERRPMEPEDVEAHLSGLKTYGIYLLKSDATVRVAVIDADIVKKFRSGRLSPEEKRLIKREREYLLSRIKELSNERGLHPLIEFSGGKGFHFWFLFETPLKAGTAKDCLTGITSVLVKDFSAFNLEVFPKQGQLTGKGMGNLVKLPLGIHRLTGKRSRFIECNDRSTEAQLDFLERVQPVKSADIRMLQHTAREKKLLVHPRLRKWAEDWPELQKLETLCPPLGQVIASCRQGRDMSAREEKILFQTIGFLSRSKLLLHRLMMSVSDYNPHLVDFKLSRLRGTPLGCKRIHSLLSFTGDMCILEGGETYAHPLLHLNAWEKGNLQKAEKVENLQSALANLKLAVSQVQRFIL